MLWKQINASLHIITVGTETTFNKYLVAAPYEDGAYRHPIANLADIYVYPNIRLGGCVGASRGVYAGVTRDETSEIVLR